MFKIDRPNNTFNEKEMKSYATTLNNHNETYSNLNKTTSVQFPKFNQSDFLNSQRIIPSSQKNEKEVIPNNIKIQIMEEKLKKIENKQMEETKGLLEIINSNMFTSSSNNMNNPYPNSEHTNMSKFTKFNKHEKSPINLPVKEEFSEETDYEDQEEIVGSRRKHSYNNFNIGKIFIKRNSKNLKMR
jgi:hypothetical protein